MKKVILGMLVFLFLLILCLYYFIPDHLTVSKIVVIKANRYGVLRIVSDKSKRREWWPDNNVGNQNASQRKDVLFYNDFMYDFNKTLYSGIQVLIGKKQWEKNSSINLIPLGVDSVAVVWKCELTTGFNPIKKLVAYEKAKEIKSNMNDLLNQLKKFAEKNENIYGYSITYTTLKDTILIATKTITRCYPTTAIIYDMINKLRTYIAEEGAKEVNYPMLNVMQKDSTTYQVMVGIPTDRPLKETRSIFNRRLAPIKDKILTTDVKGGAASVKQAYKAIESYMNDYQLTAPVIPFEYLVTDRSKEADTSKWVTKIYYPII